MEREGPLRVVVARVRQDEARGEDVPRVEAEAAALQVEEGPGEEAGSDEQHEGDSHLGRDEQRQRAAAGPDDATAGSLQGFPGVDRHRVDGRDRGREERHEERGGEREGGDGRVDRDRLHPGQREVGDRGGEQGGKAAGGPRGQEKREAAAERAEDGPLGDRLAEQPSATRPQGDADGQVLASRTGAREREPGQVGGGREQHEPHRPREGEERRARVAPHVLVERPRHEPAAPQRVGPLLREPCVDLGDGASGVGQSAALPQPGHDPHEARARVVAAALGKVERRPQLDPRGVDEAGGHHADDRVRGAREREGAADDRGVAAQLALPQPVRENDHLLGAGPVLAGAGRRARGAAGGPASGRSRR